MVASRMRSLATLAEIAAAALALCASLSTAGAAGAQNAAGTAGTAGAAGTAGTRQSEDTPAPLAVTTTWLADADVGTVYTVVLAASGGTAPYTWTVSSGTLPAGLHLVASTGAITGTPTSQGNSAFVVEATDAAQAIATDSLSLVVNAPSGYTPLTPTRLFDTRNGTGGTSGPLGAGGRLTVQVTGVDGVPGAATAVALNVTAVDATAPSTSLTVWPDGTAEPATSTLNAHGPESVAAFDVVAVGADGSVDFSNFAGTVDVLADLSGYFSPTGGDTYQALPPSRLFDTRNGSGGVPSAPIGLDASATFQVAGARGIPSDAVAVSLNLAAVDATAPATYLTLWPSGSGQPATSSLNVHGPQPVANFAIVPIGTDGQINVFNWTGNVEVLADVAGYFVPTVAQNYTPLTPARLFDTRNGTGGVPAAPVTSGHPLVVQVAGNDGVPPDATGVALTLTAVDASAAATYLTVWPDGSAQPLASSLNLHSPASVANFDVVRLGADGKLDVADAAGAVNVLADVAGYVGDPDAAARTDLAGADTAARTVYTNGGQFGTSATGAAASFEAAAPELTFSTSTLSAGTPGDIGLELSTDGQVLMLASQAADGTCWYEEDNEEPTARSDGLANASATQGLSYATSAPATEAGCSGADPDLAWGPGWPGLPVGDPNRDAQSDLTNAVTSAKTVYTNNGSAGYGTSAEAAASLANAEPEFSYSTGAVTDPPAHQISVVTSADGQLLVLAEQSADGTCWYVEDNEEATATNGGLANATPDQGISYASSAGQVEPSCSATDNPPSLWGNTYPSS